MTNFHDILFPMKLARGAVGGPIRNTDVQTNLAGHETRNSAFYGSRRRYEISSKGSNFDELAQITNFFEARMGRLYGFRFRDPMDNKSCAPSMDPSALDQNVGIGDGVKANFQLIKYYGDTKGQYLRQITKPVPQSILIAVDGVTLAQNAYNVDFETGIISINSPPALGKIISAGFIFDTPVRFDNDNLEFALDGFNAGHLTIITLLEVI